MVHAVSDANNSGASTAAVTANNAAHEMAYTQQVAQSQVTTCILLAHLLHTSNVHSLDQPIFIHAVKTTSRNNWDVCFGCLLGIFALDAKQC